MVLIIALTALALWGLVGTVRALRTDGYRALPTDPQREHA
ncbi:hypothetical protein JOD62_001546 [Microbacterium keratanolyticum]|nr:hypothetical protein [Microbacterium keratanolyticum]